MKKYCVFVVIALFVTACNVNPSKEARIQKLETELQQTMDSINVLERRIQTLEQANEQFKKKIIEIEK